MFGEQLAAFIGAGRNVVESLRRGHALAPLTIVKLAGHLAELLSIFAFVTLGDRRRAHLYPMIATGGDRHAEISVFPGADGFFELGIRDDGASQIPGEG